MWWRSGGGALCGTGLVCPLPGWRRGAAGRRWGVIGPRRVGVGRWALISPASRGKGVRRGDVCARCPAAPQFACCAFVSRRRAPFDGLSHTAMRLGGPRGYKLQRGRGWGWLAAHLRRALAQARAALTERGPWVCPWGASAVGYRVCLAARAARSSPAGWLTARCRVCVCFACGALTLAQRPTRRRAGCYGWRDCRACARAVCGVRCSVRYGCVAAGRACGQARSSGPMRVWLAPGCAGSDSRALARAAKASKAPRVNFERPKRFKGRGQTCTSCRLGRAGIAAAGRRAALPGVCRRGRRTPTSCRKHAACSECSSPSHLPAAVPGAQGMHAEHALQILTDAWF